MKQRGNTHAGRKMSPAHPRASLTATESMACDRCGTVLPYPVVRESRERTCAGIRFLPPGRCEPPEYVTVCPECGGRDTFQRSVPEDLSSRGLPAAAGRQGLMRQGTPVQFARTKDQVASDAVAERQFETHQEQ